MVALCIQYVNKNLLFISTCDILRPNKVATYRRKEIYTMCIHKIYSPYRIVGTMLKNWHFSPVDAVADGGTAPTDANPITKAAEKYAESRISNVTGYNRMAKHIRKADKGRKWEDVIIKLVDSVAYSRNSAPQAPTPPDIVSMTYKKNTARQFKTSLYEKDVDAVVRGEMEAQELNDKIVGALAESRDKEDYDGLQEMLDALRASRYPNSRYAPLIENDVPLFNACTGEPNAVTVTDDIGTFVENIITAVEDMRNAKPGYNGTCTVDQSGGYKDYTGFEQRAQDITIYVSPRIRAKILVYLKSTRGMDFTDLGADLVAINKSVTIEDAQNNIYDVACAIDNRAVGLVHYGNEVRAGAFNPDAWATPFVLNEVGNFYYSNYFSSSFHMLKRS